MSSATVLLTARLRLQPLARRFAFRSSSSATVFPSTARRSISTASSPAERHGSKFGARLRYFLAVAVPVVAGGSLALYAQRRQGSGSIHMDARTKEATNNAALDVKGKAKIAPFTATVDIPGEDPIDVSSLPREQAVLATAPHVPPPITRTHPVLLEVPLTTRLKTGQVCNQYKYEQWTFNGTVPAPFIRARVGDVVELAITNTDPSGNPHNIDCHAFLGPGGGSAITTAEENQTKRARFRLLCPGLYIYHCAAAPVPVHIANGMYGLLYVQPADEDNPLPPVDREYYVMQSEFYHEPPELDDDTGRPSKTVEFSYPAALAEEPSLVVFNGHEAALTRDTPLKAQVGESVRIFFGNAGPNLTSSFHVIGSNFRNLWREGDVVSAPAQFVQTTAVPPGSATIVDMKMLVPGTYTLVDHAIFRLDKGAVGYLNVSGEARTDVYYGFEPPEPCVGCKLHP